MSMTDPLGDMLTRIRNAQMRRKNKVSTPGSRLRGNVLDVRFAKVFERVYEAYVREALRARRTPPACSSCH